MPDLEMSSPVHEPQPNAPRPKGILKNPSFHGGPDDGASSDRDHLTPPPSAPLSAQEEKDLVIQNTLQNAGPRRSSSAARRSSGSRRHSSAAGLRKSSDEDPEKVRLKWDEANLYLAEQESGGRMKITEPKTPFEYGNSAMDEVDDEEDVAIDPRFINIDEMEMKQKKSGKKARESEIPGLELGEPEDEHAGIDRENDRIVRPASMSRDSSKDKHVSVDEGMPGMPAPGEEAKHKEFEEQRRKHYEMTNVKNMLGHPEYDDDDEELPSRPSRGINGVS